MVTSRRVFVFLVGAGSTHNRYGILSPILVDSSTRKAPESGEFEFLPILDMRPPVPKREIPYLYSYAELSKKIRKVNLEELVQSAWRQRYEIMSGFWSHILQEVATITSKSWDIILHQFRNIIYNHQEIEDYLKEEIAYDIEEITEALNNQNFEELSSKRTQQIMESVAHADPAVDENRRILSYGDHPRNRHGIASKYISKNDIILFISRLVPWDKNRKKFVAHNIGKTRRSRVVQFLRHIVTYNKLPLKLNEDPNKKLNKFRIDLVYVPYVYEYYLIGYLIVDEILKIDEILDKYKDPRKAKSHIEELAKSDRRIMENPHYHRFMNEEEDIKREAMWIFLGKEDSRLFDKAVVIENNLLYNKLLRSGYIKYFDKREYDEKYKLLRGSFMIVDDGVDIIEEYLRQHDVEINL